MLSNRSNIFRVLRFGTVGVINTAIDVIIFYSLHKLGFAIILANIISTSVALGVSLILNKKFTFKHHGLFGIKHVTRYVLITLVGLWVLQPIVIYLVVSLSSDHLAGISFLNFSVSAVLIGKLCATVVTMIWNYVLYGKLVFVEVKLDTVSSDQNEKS